METLRVGDKAYLDTLHGLVACKVLDIRANTAFLTGPVIPSSNVSVKVQITGKNAIYQKGEIFSTWAIHTVPRKAIARHKYDTRIRSYLVDVPAWRES